MGACAQLDGFMNEDAFRSVVADMRLPDGTVFPLPVLLDVSQEDATRMRGASSVTLLYQDTAVGVLALESIRTVRFMKTLPSAQVDLPQQQALEMGRL